ncbi:MAG: lamin tail domain-containing protein [Elusimicrobia bacterium]|nr:lamin tail domain-containing protein [Elusimicrobiota bacterium]
MNKDRLVFTVSDVNFDLFAKRLVMDSVPDFTWTDADGAAALEANLASTTVGGYSFNFWGSTPTPIFTQTGYRFFKSSNTTNVGSPLAAKDSPALFEPTGAAFRLRSLVRVDNTELLLNGQGFRLQFAGKGDGTCEAPSGGDPADYTDVTGATIIAFNDDAPADNDALTANIEDPTDGALTIVNQTYEEVNNATNTVAAIPVNQAGKWDFSLKDNGMKPGTAYCFRLIKDKGALLNTYKFYPQIVLKSTVSINEVYPSSTTAAGDWVEFYNNTTSTSPLVGWKLYYVENTIDLGGTENTVWTGQAGDKINAMSTFTVTPSLNLNGAQSYHLKLRDNAGLLVNQVQWPVLSESQSFARITDGHPSLFEIDPTPTKNYANHITTEAIKINEVAYGALGVEFVEIYNTSAISTQTLGNYALRNSTASAGGLTFKFTRKIYPQNYTVIDFSSISDDGKSYADIFGPPGLASAGDFLALENSTGSTVDNVTWQSGTYYTRYNYKAQQVSADNPAPADSATSIGRRPNEGDDTGNDNSDFASTASTTIASQNNGAGTAVANTLKYPVNTAAPQFLARKFPITIILGEASKSGGSAGGADNLVFTRTGGDADLRSPHIYRLGDIGFNLDSLSEQTTVQTGFSFNDQDGYPLVSSTTYKIILNTDTGTKSAPQINPASATYEDAVHTVTASTSAPLRINDATRSGAIKLDISNNSPAGFNNVELCTTTFKALKSDLTAMLTSEAKNLFDAIMLVRDSTSAGTYGIYEPAIDVSTIAHIPLADISLDAAGLSTFTVLSPDLLSASIPAASTRTFYAVFETTKNASTQSPNVFRVRFDPASVVIRDSPSDLVQDFTASAEVTTDSITIIAPAKAPPGTAWPYVLPGTAAVVAMVDYYTYGGDTVPKISSTVYLPCTDGYLRAVLSSGTLKWEYKTVPLSPIRTSPLIRLEGDDIYLYFANDNGDVYKLRDDETSAALIWTKALGVIIKSNIMDISVSTVVYFGADDKKVYCLAKADGAACSGWTNASAITAAISGAMSIDDRDTINLGWIGLEDGKVVALKTADGTSPTDFLTGGAIKSSPYLDAKVADTNNVLFFTSSDGKLYARVSSNLSNTPAGWTDYDTASPIYTSPFMDFISAKKYFFFGNDAGNVHKVSTNGVSEAGWPFKADKAVRSSPAWVPGSFVGIAEDYVYFGCDDGYIYGIDAATGKHRDGWPVATGGAVRTDLSIDTDYRTLTVGSADGKVYLLNIGP